MGTDIDANPNEINILSGATSASTITLTNTDRLIINDDGNMIQVDIESLKNYTNSNFSLNDLTDGKANDTDFENSLLIGDLGPGTLDNAEFNVGVGYGVFSSLTGGDRNMGLGYNSLNKLEDGSGNVAIGAQTLTGLVSGYRNVAIGRQAGRDINDPGIGQTNFVDGLLGGADLVSGNENVYIGSWTQASAPDVSNETVIGFGSTGKGPNSVTIGNANVEDIYLSEDEGATVYTGSLNVAGNLSGEGSISGFNANIPLDVTENYTLTSSDNGKVVLMNSASSLTLTIPANELGTGFNCLIVQKGTGNIQIQHASGTDYIKNRSSEVYTAGQYAVVSIICIGGDLFIVSGDTSGS